MLPCINKTRQDQALYLEKMHLLDILHFACFTEIMIASSISKVQGENHALYIVLVEQHHSKSVVFSPPLLLFCIFRLFSLVPDHQFANGCLQIFPPQSLQQRDK